MLIPPLKGASSRTRSRVLVSCQSWT